MNAQPKPLDILLHQRSRRLEVRFDDGQHFFYDCEYLRVHSPSAEVSGHGAVRPPPVAGKRTVGIDKIEAVGQYAVRLHFDDGHNTGLYSWQVLYDLGRHQQQNWQDYLARLSEAGLERDEV